MPVRRLAGRALLVALVLLGTLLADVAGAQGRTPAIAWAACAQAPGFECATVEVPRDHSRPNGATLDIAVTRLPASDPERRIGSLFFNFGGPGATAVDILQAVGRDVFAALNDRFDLVAFDPRGVGQSRPAIDCRFDQEPDEPAPTPETIDMGELVREEQAYVRRCIALNPGIMPWVATANVARDMDLIRRGLGENRISYIGFSYGTFLGALYGRLFGDHVRSLVLDGAVDPEQSVDRPLDGALAQGAAFERALGRWFQACAAHQDVCLFGGDDPHDAFDVLLERMDAAPLPAGGPHPAPVDGDDLRAAAGIVLYAKQLWPILGLAAAEAQAGDGTLVRALADLAYGRLEDGSYDPLTDRFVAIFSLDARWPDGTEPYRRLGDLGWKMFDHFYLLPGYDNIVFSLSPFSGRGAYFGPFRFASSVPTPLVVSTTYDPATPYRAAKGLIRAIGAGRLLTMRGDGHTAYTNGSPCIDAAVEAYLEQRVLPAAGTACRQEVPFALSAPAPTSATGTQRLVRRLAPRITEMAPAAVP